MNQLNLPFGFWFESPSTFTFIFWIVLWLWGLQHLKKKYFADIKRIPGLYRLVNGMLLVGLVAFIYDSNWIVFQVLKFGRYYPSDVGELLLRLGQNLGFLFICFVFTKPLFDKKILKFHTITYDLLLLQSVYFIAWFYFAPNLSWTDWTFAIRNGFPGSQVIASFFISHILGKLIQGAIFISLWKRRK